MGVSTVLWILVALLQPGGNLDDLSRPAVMIQELVRKVVPSLSADTSTDMEIGLRSGGRSNKKQKAPAFPGVPKSDEPLVEIVFCVAGLVALFVLWAVYESNGGG